LFHALVQRSLFGFALPAQDHEVVGIGHDARAEALLKPEHLPSQHEPADVKISPAVVRSVNLAGCRACCPAPPPRASSTFLGYSLGRMYSARTGKAYLGFRPVSRDPRDDAATAAILIEGFAQRTSVLWRTAAEPE
jgi:hypothetical protein